jgi:tRNA G18 (ribose-2'-O)-methylase SpoU
MRGYFGIGAEGISKPMNLGALARSADISRYVL